MAALYRKAGMTFQDEIQLGNTPIEIYASEVESARDVLKFDQGNSSYSLP
jgi:hypothetical protein